MKVFILLVLFFTQGIFAQDVLEGKLVFQEPWDSIKLGDIVQVSLEISPVNMLGELKKDDLQGEKILNESFYITNVQSSQPSKNNPDVWIVSMVLAYIKEFKINDIKLFELGDLTFPVVLENFKQTPNELKPQTLVIFNHPDAESESSFGNYLKYFLFLLLLGGILTIGFFIWGKKKQKQIERTIEENKYKKAKSLFEVKGERRDYENLLIFQELWTPYFQGQQSLVEKLVHTLEEYLYRKEWPEDLYDKLEELKSEIQKSLSPKRN